MFRLRVQILFFLSFWFSLSDLVIEGESFSYNSHVHVESNNYHVQTPNYPLSPVKFSIFVSPFTRVNVIATIAIIIITILNIVVYKMLPLHETNYVEKLSSRSHSQTSFASEYLLRRFSLRSIISATRNFDDSNVIGKGGYGKVYKGIIDNGAIPVAIKRLNPTSKQGANEFFNEIEMLSKFRHCNLISLIGYCNDSDEMILVYEYMEHGALADHLYKTNRNAALSWVQRLKICIEAARGLEYLHTGTNVIHRDMKSSNILLDDKFTAKVSDFGISRVGPTNLLFSHVSTKIKGTRGYVDPEYLLTHKLTKKSDVYSFGVVLFEVLSGRAVVDLARSEEEWGLVFWAQQCIKGEKLDKITDPCLISQILPNSLETFVKIANQCLRYRSKKRPTMAEVVASLESALAFQERTDSSIFDQDWLIMGANFGNQETEDYSLEQGEVIQSRNKVETGDKNEVVIDSDNGQHNYTVSAEERNRNSRTKTTRMTAFINRVRKGLSNSKMKKEKSLQDGMIMFDFNDLETATDSFSKESRLGEGGFGDVYKGTLQGGQEIAVRRLVKDSRQALDVLNGESLFANLQHQNLVKVLGWCVGVEYVLLVYEYMPHNLDSFFNGGLDGLRINFRMWRTRFDIIIGIAQGLHYLHRDSRLRITHRDLKPSNVLLDADLNPKISYLRTARALQRYQLLEETDGIVGTHGYMPAEYAMDGIYSVKSDVHSFGVMVLEIVSGKRNTQFNHADHNYLSLLGHAWRLWTEGKASELMDPLLVDTDTPSMSEVSKCVQIGLLCVQQNPEDRPEMPFVLSLLDDVETSILLLPPPKEPGFFAESLANTTDADST